MTVTEDDPDRCTDGGTNVSEVQCERDDLTNIVFNADPVEDTDFDAPFTDDDDVLFNGGDGNDTLEGGQNSVAPQDSDTLTGDEEANRIEGNGGDDTIAGG